MEIEAKFAITGVMTTANVEALDLRPYRLTAEGVEQHLDTLLDTSDHRITSSHCALRIRAIGPTLTLTFKGPNRGAGGVHMREEMEAPLAPPLSLDPDTWPDTIASRIRGLTDGALLEPILRVAVERQLWSVRRGGHVIGELALDTGAILAAGRREPIHELELELKGAGARADLDTLRARLTADLPLAPEERSKLARGLALLRHARWTLDGYTPIAALARHYVRQKTRILRHAQRDVLQHGDPNAIHDMRVAIRRLRSALANMQEMEAFRPRTLRKLRKRLGDVARPLGVVRDLDIMLALIEHEERDAGNAARSPAHGALLHAARRLRTRREVAYANACAAIGEAHYTRALDALDHLAASGLPTPNAVSCQLTREWAGGALFTRYEALLRYGEAFDLGDGAGMHQARIAGKRLRYTLEMLAPGLGAGLAPLRASLHGLQESIGAYLDTVVTLRALRDLDAGDEEAPAWRDLIQRLDAERGERLRRARAVWSAFSATEAPRALAQTVTGL